MQTLKQVIEQQVKFVNSVNMSLALLLIYQNNPKEFEFLFNEKVKNQYHFYECVGNSEYIAEFCDELSTDFCFGSKKFKICANGIFNSIDFAGNKKRKATLDDFYNAFQLLTEGAWKI